MRRTWAILLVFCAWAALACARSRAVEEEPAPDEADTGTPQDAELTSDSAADAGVGCDGGMAADGACGPVSDTGSCVGTADYFAKTAWPQVFSKCAVCHVAGGQAEATRFVLKSAQIPNFLAQNAQIVAEALSLQEAGQPLLVLKPTMAVPHSGKKVIAADSAELAVLQETLARLANPVVCPGDLPVDGTLTDGVTLLDAYGTLHKASLQLVGRPPNTAEVAAIDAGGLDALGPLLDAQMQEPAFLERLRLMFSDVLLTDGFRANNTTDSSSNILRNDYYPDNTVNNWGGENWAWRSWPGGEGIRLVEALAREPVAFVVHAHQKGAPLSTMLTAKYRLLNAYSARYFGVPYKGFAPGTPFEQIPNPQAYEEVAHVPGINEVNGAGEYAGILTTTAFLLRYPSSPTNFNRKRARFTYKYFLNFDIMKSAPRIDASAVDLNDTPTMKNPQCTGCHTKIDPLAGAFMNQDECGYDASVFYRPPGSKKNNACSDNGWAPLTHMFAPGVGPSAADVLSLADRPQALEKLAAHIAQQPAFGDSIVVHVYTSLLGRKPLQAPADPNQPGYAQLDAAFNYEAKEIKRLSQFFADHGQKLAPLVTEIVLSPTFRAVSADKAGRAELVGLGGGTLTTPENLDRKLRAVTGLAWQEHGDLVASNQGYQRVGRHDGSDDAYLLLRDELKTLFGGMDGSFQGVKTRQTQASTLSAAVVEHMALEVACLATSRDFDKKPAERLLFPLVELSSEPSGQPKATDQAAILENLRHLHRWLLAERLAADDPEILATYALLTKLQSEGLTRVKAGKESANLERPCANTVDVRTGVATAGTSKDPTYVLRAWQGVLAYLLMDDRFVLEL